MADIATAPLDAIVIKAWRSALNLPAGASELAMTWEAAGGDSLAMLQLLLELETQLGRKLDFMALEADMDVAAMVASLQAEAVGTGFLETIHLIPGQYGDGPSLARFRAWFGDRQHLAVVDLPGFDAPASLLAGMSATGRHAADIIARRQPVGPIRLAGYSFGGSVAFETSRHLANDGRQVAFLGILDAAFGAAVHDRTPASTFRPRWHWYAHCILRFLLTPIVVRRAVVAASAAVSPARGIATRQFIARRFRTEARNNWRPAPAQYPAFIAASAEFAATILPVWARLLPGATVASLPGRHFDIFKGDTLERLATAFEAALPAGRDTRP